MKKQTKEKPLTEEEMDEIAISQAHNDDAWEEEFEVTPTRILRRGIRRPAPSTDNCHLICDPGHKNPVRHAGRAALAHTHDAVIVTCIAIAVVVIADRKAPQRH